MHALATTLLVRDLRVALRRRTEAWLPIGFFVVAVALFPLGIGPEPATLRQVAPGVIWVSALLATLLSVVPLHAADREDGTLDQVALAPHGLLGFACGKALSHWLLTGLPLVVAAPLFGLLFDLPARSLGMLAATLLLGTPVLSLLGALAAALTVGLRNAGVLVVLIVLPLAVPALIFGTGAVGAIEAGRSAAGHLSLLGALLIVSLLGLPPLTAAALRLALE